MNKNIYYAMILLVVILEIIITTALIIPDAHHIDNMSLLLEAMLLIGVLYGAVIVSNNIVLSFSKSTNADYQFDFGIIIYAIMVISLLFIIINQNNIDVRGWWPFGLITMIIQSVIFASIYANISKWLGKHRIYTISVIVSYLLIFNLVNYIPFLKNINQSIEKIMTEHFYWLLFFITPLSIPFLSIHFIICVYSKVKGRQN